MKNVKTLIKTAKPIPGYEGYFASPTGVIISTKNATPIILKAAVANNGYKSVALSTGGKGKTLSVHRLVAKTFNKNPHPRSYNIVNHKNGNKLDNRSVNLEWTDHRGNSKHAAQTIIPQRKEQRKDNAFAVLKSIKDQVTPEQFVSIFEIMVK